MYLNFPQKFPSPHPLSQDNELGAPQQTRSVWKRR